MLNGICKNRSADRIRPEYEHNMLDLSFPQFRCISVHASYEIPDDELQLQTNILE